jgi:hypothetical protein
VALERGSGECWFVPGDQGDSLSGETFELVDEIVLVALVVAVVVEARAEVAVVGGGVGEQMPDDGEDRVAGGDNRAQLAAASR